jgi:anti-sigma factor RsiW
MDCRTFDNRLEDYLEGDLDFPGRFALERHAQQCFRCGQTVSDAQELRRMARQYQRVAAPPDFEAALMRRIQVEKLKPRRWTFGFPLPAWRFAAAGGLALAVVFAAVFSFRIIRERPGPAVAATLRPAPSAPAPSMVPSSAQAEPVPARIQEAAVRAEREPGSIQAAASDFPLERADAPEYIELMVPGPGDRMRVVRLPKTIRMRYGQPSEQYFIRNVSH